MLAYSVELWLVVGYNVGCCLKFHSVWESIGMLFNC